MSIKKLVITIVISTSLVLGIGLKTEGKYEVGSCSINQKTSGCSMTDGKCTCPNDLG